MKQPQDRLPARRDVGDVRGGAKGERISEYFDFNTWPEKRDLKVKRGELLALMTRQWAVQRETRWYRRLWRWLKAKRGSGPQVIAQPGGTDAAG
jgi:hypothetical protein